MSCTCSEEDLVDGLVDTADTVALGHADSDVSSVTPGSVPGVTDDVVTLITFITVTDGNDGVIDFSGASIISSDDTAGVVTEHVVAGGDSNVDGSNSDSSLDTIGIGGNLNGFGDTSDTLGGIVSAGALSLGDTRSIRVILLGHHKVVS